MASNWRDRLLPASFRGVPFWVDQAKTPVGQKGQLHEYPQRDQPFFERLGQQAKIHDLTAFIVGADCLEQRDNLLKALEQGSGELVHPWLGRMQVKVGECDMTQTRQDGGLVTFNLKFYPDELLQFPKAVVDTKEQLQVASSKLLDASVVRFDGAMALVNQARVSVENLRKGITLAYHVIEQELQPLIETYATVYALVRTVKEFPQQLSAAVKGVLGEFKGVVGEVRGLVGEVRGLKDFAVQGYRGMLADLSKQVEEAKSLDTSQLTIGKDSAAASQATVNLIQDAMLVQISQLVSMIPVATPPVKLATTPSLAQQAQQPVQRADVPVVDDVLALRDSLNEAIWQAALKADSVHYQALNTVRQTLVQHLNAVASTGVRLIDLTPKSNLPALVVAYQNFGDATRVGEVVQRNRIAHPGFIPPVPLQISRE
ncbi:DNA circularization protein [Pseudomonas gingeri]|uniref:DNA circularization N-terminal domain-containing protein n=1 Tax=Pseudomonas gingeri TaxID=117681 RepID=A0A7Y7YBB5_9PSED|nr:DNA circularization N-terminal domain-containing protein [Pseudomonas gingeri]NWB31610.1 DNA circularization N-terminal domain-containing protein [Pseudomonas gingeri]NWC33102.1 DNA circularization N-terminal domain-containing protein [Pseudomonas gingeri]NWD08039.1 DNA circularization N-terminal domain-containing protein [Pseudomonas gingeri]NWD46598.1 DNA circularization N-terminal domain-containing protein [Pseudomonas gingeri]NWE34612.1 DNA circularization N-terminal domain-containing p